MQRPYNCHIYTCRPAAKHRMARLAWDFFAQDEKGRTPGRLWFVRDTPPCSYWVVEWKGEPGAECDYDEVMPQELRDWQSLKESPGPETTGR